MCEPSFLQLSENWRLRLIFSFKDELLAKFVVSSHVKHHPDNKNKENEENEIQLVCCLPVIEYLLQVLFTFNDHKLQYHSYTPYDLN